MEVLLPLSAYNISITGNNEKRVFEKFSKIFYFSDFDRNFMLYFK